MSRHADKHVTVMEPCIPLDYGRANKNRIDEMLPGSIWKHFDGKIYSLVTMAKGHNQKEDVVVYQDIKTFEVFVRLWAEFNSPSPRGEARYSPFHGSPIEARRAYTNK